MRHIASGTHAHAHSAPIIPLPTAAPAPVVQPLRRGRLPRCVVKIADLRLARVQHQLQAAPPPPAYSAPSSPRTALDVLRSDINIARSALQTLELCLAECEATYRGL